MARWQDPQRAEDLNQAAGDLMKRCRMLPVPHNFALCFHHLQGDDAALVKAFDESIMDGRVRDPDFTWELHRRFLSPNEELDQLTATIETRLQMLVASLSTASEGSSAYAQTLSSAAVRFGEADVPPALAKLVDSVAAATRIMIETNRKLDRHVQSSSQEMTALRSKLDVLRHESLVDALTGLANRRSFDQSLEASAASARASKQPLSILMCDIDHFKKFNDTWGHQTGDQVLRLVAKCVASCVQANDVAARYGGEELSVILPGAEVAEALQVAERIRVMVEQRQIVKKSTGEKLGSITLSIGCAQLAPGEDATGMLARADEHLYEAKRTGRNRVCASGLPQSKSA